VQGKHMVLLHNGKVLVWSQGSQARVWNPATGEFTATPAPFGDTHCAGQVTLADGRVLVVGGQLGTPHVGIKITSIFDPTTNTWSRGSDMNYERWYPTATTMADGRVFVTSGDDANGTRVQTPEIYDPTTDTWTTTTPKLQGLYPFMYQLSNGKLFQAGTTTTTAYYDPATARWSAGPTAPFGSHAYSESGAMYGAGKILRAGGGDPATNRTQVIDVNAADPQWRETAPMAFPRRRMNTPILLDGTIMAVGGTRQADDKTQAILDGEIWNPETERWTTVAAMSEARMYHSTALVLPDGRVVTAGGEADGRLRAQVYSPPYLFKGPRPVISSSPGSAGYGSRFTVSTDATDIAKVALLRPSGVTHAIDMNQRYVPLSFTKSGTTLDVAAPRSANDAPPGYYMLVVTNAQGVPSVATWVRLGGGATPPPAVDPPTAAFSATPTSGTAPLKVDFSDASTGSPTSWSWDFQNDGTVDSTERNPSFTYTAPGTYSVKLVASNAGGADEEVKTGYVTVGSGGTPAGTQTFTPVADAHVKSTSQTSNYGTLTSLRVRNGGTSTDTYHTYLKFDVSGLSGPAASAKLRLFVTDGSPDGGSVFKVGNSWTETGITWATAPAIGGSSLGAAGATTNGTWAEVDVTSAVTGNGEVSFALTTTSSNSSYYTSREGATNKPQLVVSGGGSLPPGTAPTADFSATPTSGAAPLKVDFSDASTGSPTSWAWDFQNDGVVDSTEPNPSFTYTTPGTYAVKLVAQNAGGSDEEVKAGYVTVGSGPPAGTQTFAPVADAHVKSTSPTKNYGTLTSLRIRNGGTSTDTYRTYLKFDVTGLSGPPASAKLRLYVTDGSPDGGSVFAVGNAWTETGITWANAPAIGGGSLASAGATKNGTWVDLDVTPAVAGNGEVSFALTTTSSNSSYYTSREGGANRPQLVVMGGDAPATVQATSLQTSSVTAPRTALGVSALCPLVRDTSGPRAT
jgi:PKD repeat protein